MVRSKSGCLSANGNQRSRRGLLPSCDGSPSSAVQLARPDTIASGCALNQGGKPQEPAERSRRSPELGHAIERSRSAGGISRSASATKRPQRPASSGCTRMSLRLQSALTAYEAAAGQSIVRSPKIQVNTRLASWQVTSRADERSPVRPAVAGNFFAQEEPPLATSMPARRRIQGRPESRHARQQVSAKRVGASLPLWPPLHVEVALEKASAWDETQAWLAATLKSVHGKVGDPEGHPARHASSRPQMQTRLMRDEEEAELRRQRELLVRSGVISNKQKVQEKEQEQDGEEESDNQSSASAGHEDPQERLRIMPRNSIHDDIDFALAQLEASKAAPRKTTGKRRSSLMERAERLSLIGLDAPSPFRVLPPGFRERKAAKDALYGLPDVMLAMDNARQTFFMGKEQFKTHAGIEPLLRVFNLFRIPDDDKEEVLRSDAYEMMRVLGYVVHSKEDLDKVSEELCDYEHWDINDFIRFTKKYVNVHFNRCRTSFHDFDFDGRGRITVHVLRKLLSCIGLAVFGSMIEEALNVCAAVNGELTFEEFIQFLTVYHHSDGFVQEELESMYAIFVQYCPTSGGGLPMGNLRDALVAFCGLQTKARVDEITENLLTRPGAADMHFDFRDFLTLQHRVRLAQEKQYRNAFHKFDADSSGLIDRGELAVLLQHLGYHPMRNVVEEILEEMQCATEEEMDFEEFFRFLTIFRQRDGFSMAELTRFRHLFNKYKDEDGSATSVELGHILRYLGYSIGLQTLHSLVGEVDVNRNGKLDVTEFIRLMRLHREFELNRLQVIFKKHAKLEEELPPQKIFAALAESAGESRPSAFVRKAVLTADSASKAVRFETFVAMADEARSLKVEDERKMAGFSKAEIKSLREMFVKYDLDGSGDIDPTEVVKLLLDFGLGLKTKEDRQIVLEVVDEAKELAKEAGVVRSADQEDCFVLFWELVQLTRLVKSRKQSSWEDRAKNTLESMKLTKQETEDYRAIFLDWASADLTVSEQDMGSTSTLGNRIGLAGLTHSDQDCADLLHDDELTQLSTDKFYRLLSSLGVRLTVDHRTRIQQEIRKAAAAPNGSLDFVAFVQVMQWMVENNFANINDFMSKQYGGVKSHGKMTSLI